jgi:hypothetical protein
MRIACDFSVWRQADSGAGAESLRGAGGKAFASQGAEVSMASWWTSNVRPALLSSRATTVAPHRSRRGLCPAANTPPTNPEWGTAIRSSSLHGNADAVAPCVAEAGNYLRQRPLEVGEVAGPDQDTLRGASRDTLTRLGMPDEGFVRGITRLLLVDPQIGGPVGQLYRFSTLGRTPVSAAFSARWWPRSSTARSAANPDSACTRRPCAA